MSISIKRAEGWFSHHPKAKQWAWFLALWCGGLSVALLGTLPIKLLIHTLK